MVETLVEKSTNITFRAETKVTDLSRTEKNWSLSLDNGHSIDADVVILATPAKISALLVEQTAPKLTSLLNQIRYVSTATVSSGGCKSGSSNGLIGSSFLQASKTMPIAKPSSRKKTLHLKNFKILIIKLSYSMIIRGQTKTRYQELESRCPAPGFSRQDLLIFPQWWVPHP